jgi:hypothetical protein
MRQNSVKQSTIQISFRERSFCFTGRLADFKRLTAGREVRARGGLTTNSVTSRLDYIVIGSIPSVGWSYGNYGTKIEKARELAMKSKGKPYLVPGQAFLTALAENAPTNPGTIGAKIVFCNYHFPLEKKQKFDRTAFESAIQKFRSYDACYVSARVSSAELFVDIYSSEEIHIKPPKDSVFVDCRIFRQFPLDAPITQFVEEVALALEKIDGIDGSFRWFERAEGSGDCMRLLKEIPSCDRIQGL